MLVQQMAGNQEGTKSFPELMFTQDNIVIWRH